MFLGLDLGTTRVKALLVSEHGQVCGRGSAAVRMFPAGKDGVEQDIEGIWAATLSAVGQVAAEGNLSQVRAVGVSSQGGALQMCDADGRPVGNVISWLDARGRQYDEAITRELGRQWFARHTGHGGSCISVGQLLRLREQDPALVRAPNRVSFVGDVIVARLCARRAHDATSLSIAMLYNPWLRSADPELLARLNVDAAQLPELLSPSTPAGSLSGEAAKAASLPEGVPVSPAVHDQYAAALGVGAVHPGHVMLGTGTAWVLLAATARLVEPVIDDAFVCTHVVDGLYGHMLSLRNGGSAFAWMADLLGLDWQDSEEADRLLVSAPAGSDGVRFWPFLAPGAGAGLKPGTAGRLAGLRLSHGRAHLLRAAVEGLAFELARYVRLLTGAGLPADRIVMCGGAAVSRVTPQIVADVTGLPVAASTEPDTSALGAAVIARGLAEEEADLAVLCEAMRPPVRNLEPDVDSDRYARLVEEYVDSLPIASA